MHARLLLPVLLAIKLTLLCQMCDLHFKFAEGRTKTAVAIESDSFFGRTDKHSSDFISVQCHELHWTDNKVCYKVCVKASSGNVVV